MKTLILTFLMIAFLGFTACTQKQAVKNKALVLAVQSFDNDVQAAAKANFVDQEQQKVFADFKKTHTSIEVTEFEMKGDNEAEGEIQIRTFPNTLIEELKTVSGSEWKAKADAKMETKKYTIKIRKENDIWKLSEQTEKK